MNLIEILKEFETEILENYKKKFNKASFFDKVEYFRANNLQKKISNFFFKTYKLRKGSLRTLEGYVLYSLIRKFNISKIIEVGTGNGFASLICCKALQNNAIEGSILQTIDIENRWEDYSLSKVFADYSLPSSLVHFTQGNSIDILKSKIFDEKFGLCIIDGLHEYEHVKKEIELIKKNISKNFIIFFDDIFLSSHKSIHTAMMELKDEYPSSKLFFIDEILYKKFNFNEDLKDIKRIENKWIINNFKYVLRGQNPYRKSAILIF